MLPSSSHQFTLAAQSGTCETSGPVFIGEPTEVVIVGPDGAERQSLTAEEGAEYQVVLMCVDGRMVYSSRDDLSMYRVESGCFVQFVAPNSAGVVHATDTGTEVCSEILDDDALQYSEVIRNGIYQLIYRGRIRFLRSPGG